MKLFAVTVERTIMVLAESDLDAFDKADDAERREVNDGNERDHIDVNEVLTLSAVPKVWRNCIPHGGDDDRTCEQFFSEQPTRTPPRT